MNQPSKLLLIRFSAFGDVLLTQDLVSLLQSNIGVQEIHFLTKESNRDTCQLYHSPQVIVHTIPNKSRFRDLYRVMRSLRAIKYDLVLDLHSNLRSRLVCWILRRPTLRIRKQRVREFLLFAFRKVARKYYQDGPSYWRVMEGRSLLFPSQNTARNVQSDVAIWKNSAKADFEKYQQGLLALPEKYICISAESAWSFKRWPANRFIELSDRLNRLGYSTVWLGLEKEPLLPKQSLTLDLRAQLSIDKTATILKGAVTLVCNDTGLLHLAEMVGTPVVAVFGPTTKELGFGPRLPNSRTVELDLWCRPCSKSGNKCHRIFNPQKCITDITVDQVYDEIQKLL